jgi:hypothetical protein
MLNVLGTLEYSKCYYVGWKGSLLGKEWGEVSPSQEILGGS